MYEEFFSKRIASLRLQKNVSARDMSLSIGQSESYINKIENGKSFPSMQTFFYICEFLDISPKQFFDDEIENPLLIKNLLEDLKYLDDKQIENVAEIIKGLKR